MSEDEPSPADVLISLGAPPEVEWTVGDALAFLHPQPPRRTLHRWLAAMSPIGSRPLPQGGPDAKTYSARAIMLRHRDWANGRPYKS